MDPERTGLIAWLTTQRVPRNHNLFDFFNIFSGDCCKGVKAKGEKNSSWNVRKSFGYYELQIGKVNGKVHYISSDGKNAIWYGQNGSWLIGLAKNKGTKHASIYLSSSSDCPTDHSDHTAFLEHVGNNNYKNIKIEGFTVYCTKNLVKKG